MPLPARSPGSHATEGRTAEVHQSETNGREDIGAECASSVFTCLQDFREVLQTRQHRSRESQDDRSWFTFFIGVCVILASLVEAESRREYTGW